MQASDLGRLTRSLTPPNCVESASNRPSLRSDRPVPKRETNLSSKATSKMTAPASTCEHRTANAVGAFLGLDPVSHRLLVEAKTIWPRRSLRSGQSSVSAAPAVEPHSRRVHQKLANIHDLVERARDRSDMNERKRTDEAFHGFLASRLRDVAGSSCRPNDDAFRPTIPENLSGGCRLLLEKRLQATRTCGVGPERSLDQLD